MTETVRHTGSLVRFPVAAPAVARARLTMRCGAVLQVYTGGAGCRIWADRARGEVACFKHVQVGEMGAPS